MHVLLVFDNLCGISHRPTIAYLSPLDTCVLISSFYFTARTLPRLIIRHLFLLVLPSYATILLYFFLKAFTNLLDCGGLLPCIQPPSRCIETVLGRHLTLQRAYSSSQAQLRALEEGSSKPVVASFVVVYARSRSSTPKSLSPHPSPLRL